MKCLAWLSGAEVVALLLSKLMNNEVFCLFRTSRWPPWIPIRCCSSQSTSVWRVCASMKMAILRRSMALHSRCDMEVGPCDYFGSLWNIEELWWSLATPAQAFICATMGCVGGLIIGLVTEYLGCKSPARIIPWLCKVVSCFGCLIWVVSIGQVLHLSHFHAYPWVGVCLQVRNCSQHYPGSHGSTRDQLLAGMCCTISFLDKIYRRGCFKHPKPWNRMKREKRD